MTIVTDAIAADIATLTRLVAVPTGALGYGTDLSCVSDISETLVEVDAFSSLGIAQALLRRLGTPRGRLADDLSYGLDLRGYCNRAVPASELRDLAGQVRGECAKDDRVYDATVTVTSPDTSSLTVSIVVQPADPDLEPFSLTLAVESGQILLEAVG
jgi:hypothetical protein